MMATVELEHRVEGGGDPPIVVLHGLLGSGRNWQTIANRLAPNHRICLVDLRNHGRSPWTQSMTYAEMADDVLELLDRLGWSAPVVLGHSMGGKVAMRLATEHPERVGALVVVDIAPVRYDRGHRAEVDALRALDLSTIVSRADADARLAEGIAEPALRQFLLRNLESGPDGYRWQANLDTIAAAMPELIDFPSPRRTFDGACLAIVGGLSDYVGEAGASALRRWFPQAQFGPIDRAGHWPHAERPDLVTAVLETFLRSLPQRVRE